MRQAELAQRSHAAGIAAGIDVGGTKTALVVTDDDEHVYASRVVVTDRARLAEQLIELVRDVAADQPPDAPIAAVGIAAPGQVDSAAGTLRMAVNLGLAELDLARPMEAALGLPCRLEHDARAAAMWLFEQARADGARPHGLAYLAIGTGISAGIVIDGRPLRGVNGLAGEVGHLVAVPDGARCGCGLHGCLEAVAAGPAIARRAAELVAAADSVTALPAAPTAEQVFDCARAGDRVAQQVVEETCGHLARAVRGLALGFGVESIFIGGGVARSGEALGRPLVAAMAAERASSRLVDDALGRTSVELVPADRLVGARGAALIARRALAPAGAAGVGGRG